MIPKSIKRLYTIADAYMLEYSKTLVAYFIEDQAAFEGEDTNFANPFEVAYQDAIDLAEAEPTDEQRKDQLVQLTNNVETEMTNCRDVFQGAKRYVRKAFPNNIAVWNEFGFDDYQKVDKSQALFITFMTRFHSTAVKYTAQLTAPAVNFTAARIAEIETRRAALNTANNVQEKFKKDIPVFTQNRITLLNAVWAINTDVAGVGKALFKNDYAKYQHYLLPASEEGSGSLALQGSITDLGTGLPIVDVTAELQPHGLFSNSDPNGMYGFGSAPAGPATLRITHPIYNEKLIPVVIDPANPQTIDVQLIPATGQSLETDVNPAQVVNLAFSGIDGSEMVFALNTGANALQLYFATNATDPPGPVPPDLVVTIAPGTSWNGPPADIGYSAGANELLNVANAGPASGHIKVTVLG